MTQMKRLALVSLLSPVFLAGCLETRDSKKEVEEKQVMRKQVQTLQQSNADVSTRFADLEDDVRKINGRLAETDARVKQVNSLIDKGFGMADSKFKEKDEVYREEFAKLRSELEGLKAQIASAHEESKKAQAAQAAAAQAQAQAQAESQAAASSKAKEADKNPFPAAEEKFEKKQWADAARDYEKYRKAYPKGRQFAQATYKIGVCFEELGVADDARLFYEEVIAKFPKSKESKSASTRLKKLK